MCFLCRGRNMIPLVRNMHTKVEFVAFALMGFLYVHCDGLSSIPLRQVRLEHRMCTRVIYIAGSPASVFK